MTITSALLVNGGSIKLEATRCPYGPVARHLGPSASSQRLSARHKNRGLRGRFASYGSVNGRQNLGVPTCRLHEVAGRKGWK